MMYFYCFCRTLVTTPALTSAFTKAKRRVDPMQLRMREEKKRKKLQKALKKLNKKPRIVRPVQELEVSPEVLKEATTTRYVFDYYLVPFTFRRWNAM